MSQLLRRLEKLEHAVRPAANPLLIIIRFMVRPGDAGSAPETVGARSSWLGGLHPSESVEREFGEAEDGFLDRAERYLRRHATP